MERGGEGPGEKVFPDENSLAVQDEFEDHLAAEIGQHEGKEAAKAPANGDSTAPPKLPAAPE